MTALKQEYHSLHHCCLNHIHRSFVKLISILLRSAMVATLKAVFAIPWITW